MISFLLSAFRRVYEPSGFNSQALVVSLKAILRMLINRALAALSSMGTSNSMRLSKFRVIQSALEMKRRGDPPLCT